jgi:hypothetical protein
LSGKAQGPEFKLHYQQKKRNKQTNKEAGHQRLMPIILATQETKTRIITIQSQPGKIVQETVFQNTQHKIGLAEWLM